MIIRLPLTSSQRWLPFSLKKALLNHVGGIGPLGCLCCGGWGSGWGETGGLEHEVPLRAEERSRPPRGSCSGRSRAGASPQLRAPARALTLAAQGPPLGGPAGSADLPRGGAGRRGWGGGHLPGGALVSPSPVATHPARCPPRSYPAFFPGFYRARR